MLAHWTQGRRIAISAGFALCVAVLIITAYQGLSTQFLVRGVQVIAIAVAAIGVLGIVMAAVTGRMANYTDPAYGLYQGDTVARDDYPDRIIIFRDTLLRDFGDDPDELRGQVTRTVRHELAHHLGADELGVRELGL